MARGEGGYIGRALVELCNELKTERGHDPPLTPRLLISPPEDRPHHGLQAPVRTLPPAGGEGLYTL